MILAVPTSFQHKRQQRSLQKEFIHWKARSYLGVCSAVLFIDSV